MSSKKPRATTGETTKDATFSIRKKAKSPSGPAPGSTKKVKAQLETKAGTSSAVADAALESIEKLAALVKSETKAAPPTPVKTTKKSNKAARVKANRSKAAVQKVDAPQATSQEVPVLAVVENSASVVSGDVPQVEVIEATPSIKVFSEERRDNAATKIQAAFRGHAERRKLPQKGKNQTKKVEKVAEALADGLAFRKQYAGLKTNAEKAADAEIEPSGALTINIENFQSTLDAPKNADPTENEAISTSPSSAEAKQAQEENTDADPGDDI